MAKTNFTKVEEMLDQGLRRITVEHLFEMADVAAATGNPDDLSKEKKGEHLNKNQSLLISALQRDIKLLKKQEQDMYVKLGIKKKELKRMIEHPQALTPEDWQKLKNIQEKVAAYREELKKTLPAVEDDKIIENERHKHINKRFNVNEKWLPLQ